MLQPNKPLFSVIVPAYNVEDFIAACLESVLAQTCPDFELIIVDDGSTDKTGRICDDFAADEPHNSIIAHNAEKVKKKVLHQANQGLSATRNTGVEAANGEYLIFLDGDDFLEPNALENIKNALEPDLNLLRFQAQTVAEDGTKTPYPEKAFATTLGVKAFRKIQHFHFVENAWAYAYRREFFVANHFQFAAGRLNEDLGLTPLVIAKAEKVKAISAICYDYRTRQGSIMHDVTKLRRRAADVEAQISGIWPEIAQIPHAAPILNFLAMSFMTSATKLGQAEFLQARQTAKQNGWLKFVRPVSLKSIPRAILLRFAPKMYGIIYS